MTGEPSQPKPTVDLKQFIARANAAIDRVFAPLAKLLRPR